MANAVDDEVAQGSTTPTNQLPTQHPAGRAKIEIVKDTGNDKDLTEVGKIIIPGQLINENQPSAESSTDNNEIAQPSATRPRHPRSRRPSSGVSASEKPDVSIDVDSKASPAYVRESMLSQRSTGRSNDAPTGESQSPASSADEPSAHSNAAQPGTPDQAATPGPTNVVPAENSVTNEPPAVPTNESPSGASPAYVKEEELVSPEGEALAGRGRGEPSEITGEETSLVDKDKTEEGEVGANQDGQKYPTEVKKGEPAKDDTGPLQGVAGAGEENFDSFSAAKKPIEGATPGASPGGVMGEQSAEPGSATDGASADKEKKANKSDDSSAETGGEDDTVAGRARALREGKVIKQKEDQQQSLARVAELVQGMKFNSAAVVAQAQGLAEQAYKQAWQFAQEAVEDLSLVPLMIFISGPLLIVLYVIRWMFGNMMGGLFKIEVSIPSVPGMASDGPSKISIQLVPSYSLGDLQDHERHFKMLIIGGITIIIYGFIIMLLYYYTHWWEAIIAAVKGVWGSIISLLL